MTDRSAALLSIVRSGGSEIATGDAANTPVRSGGTLKRLLNMLFRVADASTDAKDMAVQAGKKWPALRE